MQVEQRSRAERRHTRIGPISVAAGAVAAWGAYFSTGNGIFALTVAVGLIWILLALVTARDPSDRWRPGRVFPPILATYSFGSIALNSEEPTASMQAVATGLAVIGFMLGAALPLAGFRSSPKNWIRTEPRLGLLTVILSVGLGIIGFLAVGAGGLPAFAADSNSARTTFFTSGIFSTIVVASLQTIMVVAASPIVLNRISTRFKLYSVLLTLFAGLGLFTLSNRGMLVVPLAAIALMWVWERRLVAAQGIAVAIVAILGIGFLGFERNLTAFGTTYVSDLHRSGYAEGAEWLAPLLAYVEGTSETFARTIVLVENNGYEWGAQFFGPLIGAQSADLFLKDQLGLTFVGFGLAIGFVNAFFLDWGLLGSFIGPFVFGLGMALIYRQARSSGSPAWIVVYSYLLVRLVLSVYGHPFAYLYYLLMPFLIYFAFRQNPRERAGYRA